VAIINLSFFIIY